MRVRQATDADIGEILEMSAKFYAGTSYAGFARMNDASVRNLAQLLIDTGVMLVACIEQHIIGMAGLLVSPFPFNTEKTIACEIVWWVEPEARNSGAGFALLREIEPACKARGVSAIQMVHLKNSPPQAALLYERLGYSLTESSYTKVI